MASALLTKPSNKRVLQNGISETLGDEGQGSGLQMEEHLPTIYKDLGSTSRTGGKKRQEKEGGGGEERKEERHSSSAFNDEH